MLRKSIMLVEDDSDDKELFCLIVLLLSAYNFRTVGMRLIIL